MKRQLITITLLGMFGGVSTFAASPAYANNRSVESALANYSDASLFYAALLNTGVLNELDPNARYTVFAPTNEAFAEIRPSLYPCFYAVQCRAQVADVLRDHIVVGRRTLKELVHEAEIPTLGHYQVYAESPYIGDYAIGNQKVLSGAEVHGNMIYRINGVIINNQQLAQFTALPPVADARVQKTITTYRTPAAYPVPGGGYPVGKIETVTEKTYVTPPASTTIVYPDGTQTTTTGRAYVVPGEYPADRDETTTITRTIITQP